MHAIESLLYSVATDAVVTSVSPTKEAMTTPGNTAPTTWDEWEKTIDWDYADFSGSESIEILCDWLLLH